MVEKQLAKIKEQWQSLLQKIAPQLSFVRAQYKAIFPEEIFSPLFSTEWGRKLSWGMLGLFSLLLVVTVGQTIGELYSDLFASSLASRSKSDSVIVDNTMRFIALLPEEHLFGKIGVNDGALPITSLQLSLIGVVKSDPDTKSRVIISEAGQPGKVYAIGDSLSSGIIVNSISDDGVLLENDGHLEKLPLHRQGLTFQGMPKPLLDQQEE